MVLKCCKISAATLAPAILLLRWRKPNAFTRPVALGILFQNKTLLKMCFLFLLEDILS